MPVVSVTGTSYTAEGLPQAPHRFRVRRPGGDWVGWVEGTPLPIEGVTLLPFDPSSPWRLGIAETATFAPIEDTRNVDISNVDAPGAAWVNYENYSHPIAYASVSDPLAVMTDTVHTDPNGIPPGGSWEERIPASARIAAGTDAHMHVITPDQTTVTEHISVTRQSSTAYTCTRRHAVDLTGSGIGPQNGTRAYGGSAIGGLIRTWEIDPAHPSYTGAIQHPLAVALRSEQLYYSGTTLPQDGYGATFNSQGYGLAQGYVWPATEQDYNSPTAYTGSIPMGSYFAIPPEIDLATLNLASPESLMVAQACQDYGVYVTDGSGASTFYMEDDGRPVSAAFFAAFAGPSWTGSDVRKIFKALRVVTNNSPSTPNGGPLGAARRG